MTRYWTALTVAPISKRFDISHVKGPLLRMLIWEFILPVLATFEMIYTLFIIVLYKGQSYSKYYFALMNFRVWNHVKLLCTGLFASRNISECFYTFSLLFQFILSSFKRYFWCWTSGGISCWVWFFLKARQLLLEIVFSFD